MVIASENQAKAALFESVSGSYVGVLPLLNNTLGETYGERALSP